METKEMTMTERKAAVAANQIYALWDQLGTDARKEYAKAMLQALDRLTPYMSATQLAKFMDFDYGVKHNYL
jgi:hypothetical protein